MDENTNVTVEDNAGVENTTAESNQQGQETKETGAETPKTYTAEELQAETDRRVTEAVKTANAKSEEAFKKQLKEARADWEKAAAEKAKAEFEKEKAAFEHERLVSRAGTQLIKNGLPEEIAELITASGATEETIGEGIAALKTAFDKAVELAVNEKLKGTPPKTGGGGNQESDPFLSGFEI